VKKLFFFVIILALAAVNQCPAQQIDILDSANLIIDGLVKKIQFRLNWQTGPITNTYAFSDCLQSIDEACRNYQINWYIFTMNYGDDSDDSIYLVRKKGFSLFFCNTEILKNLNHNYQSAIKYHLANNYPRKNWEEEQKLAVDEKLSDDLILEKPEVEFVLIKKIRLRNFDNRLFYIYLIKK